MRRLKEDYWGSQGEGVARERGVARELGSQGEGAGREGNLRGLTA